MPSQKKPLFTAYFVKNERKAKSYFKWKTVDSVIYTASSLKSEKKDLKKDLNNETNKDLIYFEKKKVKAPENWSQTAIDIAASKYFRASVKKEKSIDTLVDRIGLGLVQSLKLSQTLAAGNSRLKKIPRLKLQSNAELNDLFVEEIKYILYSQKAAFNSPVWFNLGLNPAYKLSSKSEHFAYDKKSNKIIKINDAYLRPQNSACFIQSVDDSLESIFELIKNEAKLFKFGSGSGTNFSKLRSKYEALSSGGASSGLISFLEVFDKAAGAIKSGGTTRRAAKMVCLDLDHPEILDFIDWKRKEEIKALALIQQGYSSDMDGDAYRSVSGQNSNNSIRIPDAFMKKLFLSESAKNIQDLKSNKNFWTLKFRKSSQNGVQKIDVNELWKKICFAAWSCADPGLQFHDTINRMHTCSNSGPINASNPCSEFMFLDDTACNLASLNLVQFLDDQQNLKIDEMIHVIKTVFMAMESLVDYSSYPTEKIAKNSHEFRPLGLGFSNLGSLLMRMGIPYDSDRGRALAGFISALISGVAYLTSAELSEVLGPFKGFKENKNAMLSVIKKHQTNLKKINWSLLDSNYQDIVSQIWKSVLNKGSKTGFRNSQVTAIAPTGTIGLVMDCDTTGIEPDFSLIKNKKLSGGGSLKITNTAVMVALKKLNYNDIQIEKINQHILNTGSVADSELKKEDYPLFACAVGSDKYPELTLTADAHLKMMAAVQNFISGAISKTVNLPNSATINEISEVYKKAWQLGLKSVAIYRDGSKGVQPLSKMEIENNSSVLCHECGFATVLESGCYRCPNCGTTSSCAT